MSKASDEVVIYHNPRCGKSRAALGLLQEKGIEPRVVEYLKTPLRKEELRRLLAQLGIGAEQLVRKGEDVYKQELSGKTLSESQWLDALAAHPILMERPVVVRGQRAVIGRPPEKVLEIL